MNLRLSPVVVAIATALPLVASAATPTTALWNDAQVPTISSEKNSFSSGEIILVGDQNYYSPLDVTNGASGKLQDLKIDIDATVSEDGKQAGTQIDGINIKGGNPEFAGNNLDVAIKADFTGSGNSHLAAIYIESKDDLSVTADSVNLSVTSLAKMGKSVYGVALGGGAKMEFTSKEVNINLQTSTVREQGKYSEAIGFDVWGGKVVASENTVFNINAESLGTETTINGTDLASSIYGVKFEGGQGTLAGTVNANVSANGGNAIGVGVTNYFYNTSMGENWNDSAANLNNLNVNASSKTAKAAGVDVSYTKGEDNNVILNIDGKTTLSATTESGKAYGISVTGNTTVAINGDLTATATATNGGEAYSVYLNEGSLAIAGAKTVLDGNVLVENKGKVVFGAPTKLRAQNLTSSVLLKGEMTAKEGTTVIFNQSEVELEAGSSMDVQGTVNSSQSSIVVNELLADKKVVNVSQLSKDSTLGVVASSELNDKLGADIENFANNLSVKGDGAANTTVSMKEGLVADAVSGSMNESGELKKDSVVKTANTLIRIAKF